MVLNGIPISDDQCIGDSLQYINGAFQTLSAEVVSIDNTLTLNSLTAILDDYFVPANGGSSSGVPTGSVIYYSLSSAPSGWLECNGTTIPNSGITANLYVLLQSAGNPFGGAGKIPDLRGRFIRSFGTDSIVSPVVSSAAFGVKQAGEFMSHSHFFVQNYTLGGGVFYNAGSYPSGPGVASYLTTGVAGGSETRPANVALLACIKL